MSSHTQHAINNLRTADPDAAWENLYDDLTHLGGAENWLADAVREAVINNDLAYLIKQVERHTGYVP